jgi:hypothetical protein
MSTPQSMHYKFHVTENNKLFCHVTHPSKPSHYINYGLPRLPFSNKLMHILYSALSSPSFDHVMFWAACCTAFFGFLRVSEFTCPGTFMPSHHLSLLNRQYNLAGHFRLYLKSSKTDPFHEGCTIVLGPSGGTICPVQALLRYLAIHGPSSDPLFVCCNGSPLTPVLVNSWLQTILLSAGCLAIIPATVFGSARPPPLALPAFLIISSRLWVGGLVMHICVTF